MPTLLLTGANRGIGFEAAAQFAASGHFDKIILTVRSPDKGPPMIAAAAAQSGKSASLFSFLTLDLESHVSAREAVGKCPSGLDAIVLNAGGMGGEALTELGVTQNFAMNVLGNAVLVEGLLAAGKISAGARVIYSTSEGTRNVWLFTGFQPFVRLYKEEMEGSIAQPPSRGTLGIGVRQRMNTYANSKLIGMLWIAQLAKEHPGIYFASVSPGGCGDTDVYKDMPQPFPFLMSQPPVVAAMVAMGVMHSVEAAAQRYVTAVTDETFPQKFPSGAVVGGPYIQISKSTGELFDQSAFSSYYTDAELQQEATRVVRDAMKR
jgi:NAD(P)-dependent dehydrogenase (short-subunit alcohol dehydrogenase family)